MNRVALVTGAARGIGAETVRTLCHVTQARSQPLLTAPGTL